MHRLVATRPPVVVVMGGSGCGKSTGGQLLANALGASYIEGDDLHSQENVERMRAGIALNDAQRHDWLQALAAHLAQAHAEARPLVVSCSALKRTYRDLLRSGAPLLHLVHLHGTREVLAARTAQREGHYMPVSLLDSQIATLVERQTRYVMLVKVANKDSTTVVNALIKSARRLPKQLYRSLTWDRGTEMAKHRNFTIATDIQVYFCDPHKPWQRGSNENTNGLLRQYFPKGMDISNVSQAKLDAVARKLNERPRKTLGYETPAERYRQCVESIS